MDAGVGDLWPGVRQQRKLPAITALLRAVLEHRRGKFCDLIEQVVRGGIEYRIRKGEAITRAEVDELNRLLLGVQFKIPSLCDPRFLSTLPGGIDGPELSRPEPDRRLLSGMSVSIPTS